MLRSRGQRTLGSKLSLVVLALSLVAAACGSSTTEDASPSAESNATNSEASETTASEPAVLVDTADGGQIDWNSLEGQDVVLWFWAPW